MYQWGSFSKSIPGRVGYQCSNYYRSLITQNKLEDENYQLDDQGKLRFNFKNKGFTRDEDGRMKKAPAVPKAPRVPKAPKAPKDNTKALEKKRAAEAKKKAKAEAKAARDAEKEDKTFRSSCKFDTIRRSGRANGTTKRTSAPCSRASWIPSPGCPSRNPPSPRTATCVATRSGARFSARRAPRTPARSPGSHSSAASSSS
jgi:hypothetical protein